MKIKFTWKHIDHSDAAEKYAEEKLERVTKYLHKIVNTDVIFELIHGKVNANLNIHADNTTFNAQNTEKDIYACIDGLEDKILRQVEKHHDKKHSH